MTGNGKEKKKLIYAIKFKDLPFPEIDKYVCVPVSWIIHQLDDQTVLVAYPENEAPFVTRNRTKRRERHCSEWRFYIGFIKFESENYEDVEQWIEEMLANGTDDQEESEIKDSPAEPAGSRQLRSTKNPNLSGILPEKPKLVVKPYDNPRKPLPKMLIRRPLPLRPWKPKRIEPAVSSPNTSLKNKPVPVENQVIEKTGNHENTEQSTDDQSQQKSVDTSAQSPPKLPEERQPSPVQDEQLPEIDDSDVEVEVEVVSEPTKEKRPPSKSSEPAQPVSEKPASINDHEYSLIESRLLEILTGQPKEAIDTNLTALANQSPRPPSRAHQLSQHDYAQPSATTPKQQQGTGGTGSEICSHQNTHLQDHGRTIPSIYYTPSPIDLSSQRQIPAIRRKSSSVIKKPVEKKSRVENITKNIPRSQQSYNKQLNYANHGDVIEHRYPHQTLNKSAAQNLSQLAHQVRFYEPSQYQYLQHMARMQGMISRPGMQYIDQTTYLPNAITGAYVPPNPSNQVNQSGQFLQQNQRPMISSNQIPELRIELVAPPVAAQNPQSRNLENLRKQDPRAAKVVGSRSNSIIPNPQVTEERLVLPQTNHKLLNDEKNNSRKNLLGKLSLGPVNYIEICEAAPEITQDSETQTTPESQETQLEQIHENIYQHPESNKMVADQGTEMESIEDHPNDETFASPRESMDSEYETHEHLTEEQDLPQEVPNFEMGSADGEFLDMSTDDSDYANDDYIKDTASITDERSKDGHNLMPGTQQKLSKMAEEEMLEIHGLLLTKMYKNFLNTEEYYNNLRDNTLGCLKLYETLLNKVEKIKVIDSPPIPTSKKPEAPQVVQETPAPAPEKNSDDDHNNSSIKNSPTKSKRRHTFVLPPEYDPNDSRWTLKHRNPGPGLMELMPQSRVYVNKAEFKKCVRASNNCRTLARLLLTAVFSKNALSVCSPTGAKARAFNTVEIDVRPGLDENARMVLLAFIEEYGNKRNWNTSDTAGIMSSIRTKIQEMRNKYGKTKVT